MKIWLSALTLCFAIASVSAVSAAPGDWVLRTRPIAAPAEPGAIALPVALARTTAGPAPREAWADNAGQRMVYNVTRPSLVPMPSDGRTTAEPAIILVPGGAFEFLSMDNEGYRVAAKLRPLGVRVFILKYRTLELPDSFKGFQDAIALTFMGRPRAEGPIDIARDLPYAVADAQSAVRTLRANAAKWGVDPGKIGVVGFSAGAMTALAMTQADAEGARPDFVGLIYGPTRAATVPPKAPPLFDAIAADDRFFGKDDFGLIENWRKAGASVEFHLYSGGGHGFATQPNGTTSDGWFEDFTRWLKALRLAG